MYTSRIAFGALLTLAPMICSGCFSIYKCGTPAGASEELCCDRSAKEVCLNKTAHLCGPRPKGCAETFKWDPAAQLPCNINSTTGQVVTLDCSPLDPLVPGAKILGEQWFYDTRCTAVGFDCMQISSGAGEGTVQLTNPPKKCPTMDPTTAPTAAPSMLPPTTSAQTPDSSAQITVTNCYFTDITCATKATDPFSKLSCNVGAQDAGTTCSADLCFDQVLVMQAGMDISSACDRFSAGGCSTDIGNLVFTTQACRQTASPTVDISSSSSASIDTTASVDTSSSSSASRGTEIGGLALVPLLVAFIAAANP